MPKASSDGHEPSDDYVATNITQPEEGIAFYHTDGGISVKFYRHLQEVICLPPYRMLSLLYMDCIYLLEGHNLNVLIPRIRRHRVGELYCLDPAKNALPVDGAVVLRVTRQTFEDFDE